MKSESNGELEQRVGADRVLEPRGALPQPAERLDPSGPVRPFEFEVVGRAPLPRLDLLPPDPRALRRRARARWPSGSSRSSRRGARCTTPRRTPGESCSGTVAAAGERLDSPPPIGDADRHPRLADPDAASPRADHRPRPRLAAGRGLGHRLRLRPRSLGAGPRRPAAADRARGLRRLHRRLAHPRPGAATRAPSACSAPATRGKLAMAAAREAMDGRHGRRGRRRPRGGRAGPAARALRHRRHRRPPRPPRARSRPCAAPVPPPPTSPSSVVNAAGCEPTAIMLTADGRHRPLPLDGDQVLDRRAGRRTGSPRTPGWWSAAATRPTSAPTRSTCVRRTPALREALGAPVEEAA